MKVSRHRGRLLHIGTNELLAATLRCYWLAAWPRRRSSSGFRRSFIYTQTHSVVSSLCQVTGVVADSSGQAHYVLSGTWDDKLESAKIVQSSRGSSGSEGKQKTVYQTLSPKLLWKKFPLP